MSDQREMWGKRVANWAVPPLALLTPFVAYLRYQEYPLWRSEVLIAVGGMVAAGLALDVLIELRPRSLRPALFVLLIFVSADLQYHLVGNLQIHFAPSQMVAAVGGILILLAVVTWLLRRHLETILCAMFGVMLVSVVVLPTDTIGAGVKVERAVAARSDLPAVVHLVLDEHIGMAGIPADIEGGSQLRADLEKFYQRFGFTLYPRAYSAFAETHYSLAALLNGIAEPPARDILRGDGLSFEIAPNEWFRQLAGAGYRLRVYQSEYLDLCSAETDSIDFCYVYPVQSVASLVDLDIAPGIKAAMLTSYFAHETLVAAAMPWLLRGPGDEPSKTLKDLPQLSTLPALAVLDRVADDLGRAGRGTAYFVHALLPHYAYVFDRSCRPWPEPGDWLNVGLSRLLPAAHNTPATRERRYRRYFEQLRCTYEKLGVLFERMKTLGLFDDAIVIVHGDHGSRISLAQYRELGREGVSDRDIIDNVSTLFAVRAPGTPAATANRATSIHRRFSEQFLHRSPEPDRDLLYLHGGQNAAGLPYGTRTMPAFPDEE